MSPEPRTSLVETTDCLEAVSVIRAWKNILFIVIVLSMLLLLGSFFVADFNLVRAEQTLTIIPPPALPAEVNEPQVEETQKIKQAAKQIAEEKIAPEPNTPPPQQAAAEPNQPAQIAFSVRFAFTISHIIAIVRFLNFILIPAAVLYCLTILFAMKVSLIGRLGGINHISRAFFMSLVFVVLLLPWQVILAPVFAGAMFTPGELLVACQTQKDTFAQVSFYLRFVGYWLLVLLLLLISQVRSMRWAKATLRRLEVV